MLEMSVFTRKGLEKVWSGPVIRTAATADAAGYAPLGYAAVALMTTELSEDILIGPETKAARMVKSRVRAKGVQACALTYWGQGRGLLAVENISGSSSTGMPDSVCVMLLERIMLNESVPVSSYQRALVLALASCFFDGAGVGAVTGGN